MEEYLDILKKIVQNENYVIGNTEFLCEYFKIIKEIGLEEIVRDDEKFYKALELFEQKYGFSKYGVYTENSQKNILEQIIYLIKTNFKEKSKYCRELIPLIVYIDSNNILSEYLFITHTNYNYEDVNIWMADFLENFTVSIGTKKILPEYDCVLEMKKGYDDGLKNHDFIAIYDFIDYIVGGWQLRYNDFINLFSYIIVKTYETEYIKIINKKNNVLEIKFLIENLSIEERLQVASESENILVKFEVIKELVQIANLDTRLLKDLLNIIKYFTKDIDTWKNLIIFYFKSPSLYPRFFSCLGVIIQNGIEEKFIEVIIKELKFSLHINEKSKDSINNCFNSNVLKIIKKELLEEIYTRWENMILSYEGYVDRIYETEVIDIVIYYIIHIMDDDIYNSKYNKYTSEINEIDNTWFVDKSAQISYKYKRLSILSALKYKTK